MRMKGGHPSLLGQKNLGGQREKRGQTRVGLLSVNLGSV